MRPTRLGRLTAAGVRGVLAGAAATGVMSAGEWTHIRLHRRWGRTNEPIDYDVSGHVVTAAARVLRVDVRTDRQARALLLLTHVGYGSAFGVGTEVLRRTGWSRRSRALAFAGSAEMLACALFPLLGGTPPPWGWPREALIASVVEHLIYGVVAVAVDDRLGG